MLLFRSIFVYGIVIFFHFNPINYRGKTCNFKGKNGFQF